MRTSLTLYSFRFTVLSSLGLLHGCGGSVAPGPTRSTTEGATTGNATTGNATGTTTGTGTGTTTGSGTGTTTGTGTGSGTGTTTGAVTGTGTGTTTGTTTGTGTGTTTGTGTGTTTGTGTGTTTGTGTPMSVCDGPETDLGGGHFQCANGLVHRTQAVACSDNYQPRPEAVLDRFEYDLTAAGGVAAGGAAFEDPGVGGSADADGTGMGGSSVGGATTAGSVGASLPAGGAGGAGVGTGEPPVALLACTYDTDCTERYGGLCDAYYQFETDTEYTVVSSCWYFGCATDADCDEGQVCRCDGDTNQCTSPSDCRTDADCSDGNVCARFEYENGCGLSVDYACTTPADTCHVNADCNALDTSSTCQPSQDPAVPGAHCGGVMCEEGRPFLVNGVARVATLEARADWTLPQSPKLFDLTDAERRHLAGEWQRTALAEHASIAAFARFALDLLAVGAPPQLLEATQQAMRDETLHAKLAFGLATGYAGRGIGPGPLSCDGALAAHDLESITLNTVLEGCIGETLAALDAQHALEHCVDPVVRAVLEQIAKDEAQHAELAWKFVQWALAQEPSMAARVESLVQREFANAKRCASSAQTATEWTRAHGVLPEADRVALRLSALEQVVLPCMRALCATVRNGDATHENATHGAATVASAAALVA